MRIDFTDERVLAVVAHPDDAEMLCAGTLARARGENGAIGVCVLCRGDKGQPDPPIDDLADRRQVEMEAAARLLGAQLFSCGYGDGELMDGIESRAALVEIYRLFQPTLILAHAANDYHADHRSASTIAEAASWFAASKGHETDSPPLTSPPALWWMDTVNMCDFTPEIYVDISEHVDLKVHMLRCHESQLARANDTDFSPLEDMMLLQCRARGAQSGVVAAEAFRSHRAWKRVRAW